MTDYVLRVNYQAGDDPVLIPLHGYSPADAETAHKALETEIEHAAAINAPVLFSRATDEDPDAGVPIDPERVTGVDLISPSDA